MNKLSRAIARWGTNAGNTTIRRRWMTLFVFFVAVPILIIIILFLNSLKNEAKEQAAGYSERYVSQVQRTLLSHMGHVEAISSGAIRSIYDELVNDSDLQGQYEEYYEFSNLFNSVSDETLIDRFRLYAPRSKVYAHQMESFFPLDFLEERVLDAFRSGRKNVWIADYDRTRYYSRSTERVLTFVTALRSSINYDDYMAVLFADIPIERICELINMEQESEIMLIDQQGQILAARDVAMIGQMLEIEDTLTTQAGHAFIGSGKEERLMAWAALDNTPYYLVNITDQAQFQTGFAVPTATVVIGLIICIAIGFLLMFSYALDMTIARMNRAVKNLQAHSESWMEEESGQGKTLHTVEQEVDEIAKKINGLMKENYQIRLESREAELKALQAQINPHFLYNTLDSIRWMILDGDEEMSVKMVNSLSQYYRFSLNKGRDIVPLRDEYQLILSYLTIQKMRFDSEFDVEWNVDERAFSCRVPKLTLQPIVENAILHSGSGASERRIVIRISIALEGEYVVVRISDNGRGMSEEMIAEAFSRSIEATGYGLRNVNRRLQLMQGSMKIESAAGEGTVVTLTIPYRDMEHSLK